jgi:hypothetical protein
MVLLMPHEMLSQFKLKNIFTFHIHSHLHQFQNCIAATNIFANKELSGYLCKLSPSSNASGAQRIPGCEAGFFG